MDEVARLRILRQSFERLMHLAGYTAAILQRAIELEVTATAFERLAQALPDGEEKEQLMSTATILREAAASVRTSAEGVKAAIDAAIARLSDNPTAADIEAALTDLNAASAANTASLEAAGTIDPDDTSGGVVVDPEDEDEVVEG